MTEDALVDGSDCDAFEEALAPCGSLLGEDTLSDVTCLPFVYEADVAVLSASPDSLRLRLQLRPREEEEHDQLVGVTLSAHFSRAAGLPTARVAVCRAVGMDDGALSALDAEISRRVSSPLPEDWLLSELLEHLKDVLDRVNASDDRSCDACLLPLSPGAVRSACGHAFHAACLVKWWTLAEASARQSAFKALRPLRNARDAALLRLNAAESSLRAAALERESASEAAAGLAAGAAALRALLEELRESGRKAGVYGGERLSREDLELVLSEEEKRREEADAARGEAEAAEQRSRRAAGGARREHREAEAALERRGTELRGEGRRECPVCRSSVEEEHLGESFCRALRESLGDLPEDGELCAAAPSEGWDALAPEERDIARRLGDAQRALRRSAEERRSRAAEGTRSGGAARGADGGAGEKEGAKGPRRQRRGGGKETRG